MYNVENDVLFIYEKDWIEGKPQYYSSGKGRSVIGKIRKRYIRLNEKRLNKMHV